MPFILEILHPVVDVDGRLFLRLPAAHSDAPPAVSRRAPLRAEVMGAPRKIPVGGDDDNLSRSARPLDLPQDRFVRATARRPYRQAAERGAALPRSVEEENRAGLRTPQALRDFSHERRAIRLRRPCRPPRPAAQARALEELRH